MRAALGGVIVLALLGLGAAVVSSLLVPSGGAVVADATPTAAEALEPPTALAEVIVVHVVGAVREPGIVELPPGSRVVDAIAAARGPTDEAALAGVNLARELVDGEQLLVPTAQQVAEGTVPGGSGAAAGTGAGAGTGQVNLNSADAALLDSLPGIGPAIAARIIAWRDENGPFRSVDELLAVSGIGEKTLEGFRDLVTV